jgi:hypothetical protein
VYSTATPFSNVSFVQIVPQVQKMAKKSKI